MGLAFVVADLNGQHHVAPNGCRNPYTTRQSLTCGMAVVVIRRRWWWGTPDTWSMFDAMVARHNKIFRGCWCIYVHPDSGHRRG